MSEFYSTSGSEVSDSEAVVDAGEVDIDFGNNQSVNLVYRIPPNDQMFQRSSDFKLDIKFKCTGLYQCFKIIVKTMFSWNAWRLCSGIYQYYRTGQRTKLIALIEDARQYLRHMRDTEEERRDNALNEALEAKYAIEGCAPIDDVPQDAAFDGDNGSDSLSEFNAVLFLRLLELLAYDDNGYMGGVSSSDSSDENENSSSDSSDENENSSSDSSDKDKKRSDEDKQSSSSSSDSSNKDYKSCSCCFCSDSMDEGEFHLDGIVNTEPDRHAALSLPTNGQFSWHNNLPITVAHGSALPMFREGGVYVSYVTHEFLFPIHVGFNVTRRAVLFVEID